MATSHGKSFLTESFEEDWNGIGCSQPERLLQVRRVSATEIPGTRDSFSR